MSPAESRQITDFIVSTYNAIDYAEAIQYFDSWEDLLTAAHANTGSEYDLNEVFLGKSDAHYRKMATVIMREFRPNDIHDILALPFEQKYELFLLLRKHTWAMGEQIAKFLHLPVRKEALDGAPL